MVDLFTNVIVVAFYNIGYVILVNIKNEMEINKICFARSAVGAPISRFEDVRMVTGLMCL